MSSRTCAARKVCDASAWNAGVRGTGVRAAYMRIEWATPRSGSVAGASRVALVGVVFD